MPPRSSKTRVLASAASPPRSPSDRLADCSPAPSPFRNFRSAPLPQTRLRQRAVTVIAVKLTPRSRVQPHHGGKRTRPDGLFRGLANPDYYILTEDKGRYADY